MSQPQRVLVYLLRRDLRLADNPIFHEIAKLSRQSQKPFTHVLPLYVFPAEQVEVSGFLKPGEQRSPYQEARSRVGGFWRCGRLRAKFMAECVWDLKGDLRTVGSGLEIRVGSVPDIVRSVIEGYRNRDDVEFHGLWMTSEEGWEEKEEEHGVQEMLTRESKEFKLWHDEKYLVDDRDLPFQDPQHLSDVFTTFRKTVEPLKEAPRKALPRPDSNLFPLPSYIPPQPAPFEIPDSLEDTIAALHKPIDPNLQMPNMPSYPDGAQSAFPFTGGSKTGLDRVRHLIISGAMSRYKDTRNGLLGQDFSTKLAAWLTHGSITPRQIHWMLVDFEDAKTDLGRDADGYGKGENKGTEAVRFELLWRDYMRLCTRKFGRRLFDVAGFRGDSETKFKLISSPYTRSTEKKNKRGANDEDTRKAVERLVAGRTGTGLIDAAQRELFLTGYTSNRARQNVASYLAKHLAIDWRLGAEWYEANLIDYDVSSNWGNWQYVSGVGNDPRGQARVFNPVKQALDYDPKGDYVREWVPELRDVGRANAGPGHESAESVMGVFQAWRLPAEERKRLGLEVVEWVEKPLVRIDFNVNRRGAGSKRGARGESGGGGGGGGGSSRGAGSGRDVCAGRPRGRGRARGGGGRLERSGPMEKAGWGRPNNDTT